MSRNLLRELLLGKSPRSSPSGDGLRRSRPHGALTVYLLGGSVWATLFMILELVRPGSFGATSQDLSGLNILELYHEFVYLSFITLTTVGFGDITPVSSPSRALVILEAIAGIFYVAVIVARLLAALRETLDRRQLFPAQNTLAEI